MIRLRHICKSILNRYVVIYLLLISCISSYDPKLEPDNPKLTVDGWITDQPGPYTVTLRYSSPYINNETVFSRYVSDAIVSIENEFGEKTQLINKGTGKYETDPAFVGEINRSYTLNMTLPDGTTYQSHAETLKPVPPIDTVYTSYTELYRTFLRGEFTVFIDFTDASDVKDYYQWDWTHYQFEPYCRISPDYTEYGAFRVTKCCGPCWSISQCYGCISIFSDEHYDGRKISGVKVLKIPYDSKEPYFVQIRLKSLTESAFKFWRTVSEQINNSGGIFDKPPITIKGNIYNTNDPDEQVLGYFGASAVYMVPIYIDRSNIENIPFGVINPIYNELIGCIACEVGAYRTDQRPAGW
jgi:hypothetical protein